MTSPQAWAAEMELRAEAAEIANAVAFTVCVHDPVHDRRTYFGIYRNRDVAVASAYEREEDLHRGADPDEPRFDVTVVAIG